MLRALNWRRFPNINFSCPLIFWGIIGLKHVSVFLQDSKFLSNELIVSYTLPLADFSGVRGDAIRVRSEYRFPDCECPVKRFYV